MSGAASRTTKPCAASTVSRVTSQLQSFFSFLAEEHAIEEDPTKRLEHPRVPRRVPDDVLTPREVKSVLKACSRMTPDGLRNRALIDVLWGTGVRRSELRGLDVSDLNRERRELLVRGKGSKERIQPLSPMAFEALVDYLERGRPSLVTRHDDGLAAIFLSVKGRRLSETGLREILLALGVEAGVRRRVRPHTLRRSFATSLVNTGTPITVVQRLMGHARVDTTVRCYIATDAGALRRELILRHPRERLDP